MGVSKNPFLDPKIQDGGHPPSWKSLNRHIQNEKSLDFDEIWYTNADLALDNSHSTKYNNF